VTAPATVLRLEASPESLRTLLVRTWASRDLIATLARKDFIVRYRRASLGLLWAVGLPAIQALVIVAVFSRVVRVETGVKYPVFVFAGMTAWSFFSGTVSTASTSVVDGSGLASKIYFPRLVLPLVSVGTNLYGFVAILCILIGLTLVYGVHIGIEILLIVPATLLLVLLSLGFALVASALHVYFRDIRFIIQASLLAWFYMTPIFYPTFLTGGAIRVVVLANPVTGVVELFRAATVGADAPLGLVVGTTAFWSALLLTAGLALHRHFDRLFTDLL
jgi:lipopolysaccharide transport system permease protein